MTPELSVGACYGYRHRGLTLFQSDVLLTSLRLESTLESSFHQVRSARVPA